MVGPTVLVLCRGAISKMCFWQHGYHYSLAIVTVAPEVLVTGENV